MEKIFVYLHYPCHLHHLSCSMWSALRVSTRPTFEPCWIYFPGSQIRIEGGGDFRCSEVSEIGILEVAQGFVLRGWSVAKSLKVSRSGAREGWIWEVSGLCVGDSEIWCEHLVCFSVAVLGFSISTFVCIYWFLTCLHQSTHFVVVRQMWISPLVPDSPKNSNRSWNKSHWIDEDEWDRKEFGGRGHRIIIDRMLVLCGHEAW